MGDHDETQTGASPSLMLLRSNPAGASNSPMPVAAGLPAGHAAVGAREEQCPFALIQAALDSPSPADSALPAIAKKKAAQNVAKFQKHDLMESSIPEGISMRENALKFGLDTSETEDDDAAPSGVQLMCPASGALINMGGGGDPHALHELVRQASAKSGAFGRTGSFNEGSKAGKSKASSKGASKQASSQNSSKRSKNKKNGKHQIKRRQKRTITFSEWEADTYIPQIKACWSLVLVHSSRLAVASHFYAKFLGDNPELEVLFTSPKEVLALKLANILDMIVASVDSPAALHETLRSLAPMHLKKGVSAAALPPFGIALVQTLTEILGSNWTTAMKAAWEWLWAWITQSMIQSLEEASVEATILSQSWDMACDNCPGNEFGELFFDVLFELAPNMKTLFNKPKQILSVKFMEMVSTLVSFNNDPIRMEQQSQWLGMRHVAYGARPQHTAVLGQVIISTLEQAVGGDWTAEMDKCWTDLWTQACNIMLHCTELAETHGNVMIKMWEDTRSRTTCAKFGSMLRKMLLSGTEWVQGLSQGGAGGDAKKDKKEDKSNLSSDNLGASGRKKSTEFDGGKSPHKVMLEPSSSNQDLKSGGDDRTAEEKKSDADAVGQHFWDMMTVLLELLWQPEQMNEKLVIMTKRFFEMGIRQAHLSTIGSSLCTCMERVLSPNFGKDQHAAWKWFWKKVSDDMAVCLDVLESGDVGIIRAGWEDAKTSLPAEELGELFFKELARIAPHVTHLFKRPKRIQALQFINVIDMLVSFNEEPEKFFDDLKPLTIRHIKYGVKADYARAFGLTVMTGMTKALGDKFNEVAKKAWTRLWTRVSSCVTRSLNVGSNLVIVSLVQDDIDNFMEAMACVPRGERFETLTHIDVNGEIISPLDWSISGGQHAIAQWVLQDLLAIRADRESYYYGRETMFNTHPLIVSKLAKQMPDLLHTLLDGLMWHASMVVDGKVRVNFYIREMYGVPAENKDAWETAMGVLVSQGEPEIFNHPIIEKLLEVKWNRFGNVMFIGLQCWFTAILILFTVGFAVESQECGSPGREIRITVGAMAAFTFFLQTCVLYSQARNAQVLVHRFPIIGRQPIPRFLANPWNAARYASAVMLMVISFYERCDHFHPKTLQEYSYHWHTVLTAATSIFLWMQFIQVLLLSDKIAAFTYSIGRMSFEIFLNFTIIFVILIAFGIGLSIVSHVTSPERITIEQGILSILEAVLGLGNDFIYSMDSWSLVFMIFSVILILTCCINILIAQLCNIYGKLSLNQEGYAKMNRAYICVEMESFLSIKRRDKYFVELNFDEPLEFDSSDEGPAGGIQVLLSSAYRSHPKYIPDRVTRFTGEASPMDPWPSTKLQNEADYQEADLDEGIE